MDYTVHGILQARILEWVAFLFSRGFSQQGIEPRSPVMQADSLPTELWVSQSVQWLNHVRLFVTPWITACQASLSITNSRACSYLCPLSQWCHPTISSSVAPFSSHIQSFPPSIRVFSNDSVLHIRWPKYWSFSFSISPSNEYSGLISFRIDWFDILAVQGTLKSLLQHHSSKPSIIRLSAFFMVQLSHPFMTGKTIALTIWTFVAKVISLLFNMLSRLVIAFIPRSRHLLISCLQSPSAVILEPKKIKSDTVSTFSPSWKKSYDKPRQHIKKQRSYFANKCLSSQSSGFSNSHVWIWELDHKEGWALKNWCFWTVLLEKALETPLDDKDIKPVNPKGNQS